MVDNTKDLGKMINITVKEFFIGLMVTVMKEIGQTAIDKVTEKCIGLMAPDIRVFGKITKKMVKVFFTILMVKYMMVIGWMAINKEKVNSFTLMAPNLLEIGKRT